MREICVRQVFACALLVVAIAALADPALACSCARNPTAAQILGGATAVFTGTAQQSVLVAPGRLVTTFTVTESFKGGVPGPPCACCIPAARRPAAASRLQPVRLIRWPRIA